MLVHSMIIRVCVVKVSCIFSSSFSHLSPHLRLATHTRGSETSRRPLTFYP